jgi:hypothetical protein
MVYKNEYILMHVTEIYNLDHGSSSLMVIRLIVVDTEYSSVLKDGEVGMS